MIPSFRTNLSRALLCALGLLAVARMSSAQGGVTPPPATPPQAQAGQATLGGPQSPDADLRARIERLEAQNQELLRALQTTSTQAGPDGAKPAVGAEQVQKIVRDYLEAKDAAKKEEESAKKAHLEAEGYRV